jgi:hypothetical protein
VRILWLTPSAMVCEWMLGSLESLGNEHIIYPYHYEEHGSPPDDGMLLNAGFYKLDLIVYISVAAGPFLASVTTLKHLRTVAPTAHLCFDASDPGWAERLAEYRANDVFTTAINCDGAPWPKGPNDETLWCSVDPRPFGDPLPWAERDIAFAFHGAHRNPNRFNIVSPLVAHSGLVVPARDDRYGTYGAYAAFLRRAKIVLNIAFSAGGHHGNQPMTKQLKARVLECAYAGACLLETRGSAAAEWFVPGEDFLTYETWEEAAHVVATASEEYLQECAANLRKKVLERMSPRIFWNKVFERAGVL